MTTVSLKKWDQLSEMQQKIMEEIGVKPKKSLAPKTPKAFKMVEYYLKVKIYCQLCRATTTEYYYMNLLKGDSNNPFLHGKSVEFDLEQEYQLAVYVRPTCRQCSTELLTWEKEKLVKKLMEAWPALLTQLLIGKRRPRVKKKEEMRWN